jgi:hypothetical protein
MVTLLPVQPWSFTVPLNATIIRACALGASKIVFISLEMTVLADQLAQILSLWSKGLSFLSMGGHVLDIDVQLRDSGDRQGSRSSQLSRHPKD